MGAPKIDVNTLNETDRAAIEARRAYQKQWRAANKERIKELTGMSCNAFIKETVVKELDKIERKNARNN